MLDRSHFEHFEQAILSSMREKFERIWKIKEVRNSILFIIGMLLISRIAAHIPVPGVDPQGLQKLLEGNQILGFLNLFSGGTLENFSIIMLGVAPYITASIIFQLLQLVVPRLEEIAKEGESGQKRIQMYTRLAAVPLAFLQAFSLIQLLRNSQAGILPNVTTFSFATIMLTVTAGTIFLMWIGELITEKRMGNGVSLLIFAGIVASLPQGIQTVLINYDPSQLYVYILFALIIVVTVAGVVVISEGQRNIPVQYAKQAIGSRRFSGANSTLPLRINMAGVIPIIFAVSLILLPSLVSQYFINHAGIVGTIARHTISLFQNQLFYGVLYFLMVFGFTYFYTAVVFQPQKIAENLQRQGGYIPGIRPGKETEMYLSKIMGRLIFTGALFLGLIAILPLILQALTGTQSLAIGGTSLLIVVSVAIETAKQIDAQLTVHEYDRV